MRKILSFGALLIAITYALPIGYSTYYTGIKSMISDKTISTYMPVETLPPEEIQNSSVETTNVLSQQDDISIKLLVDDEVIDIPLEEYVASVVSAEISSEFPIEAIKAQAVAARTYALYKVYNGGSDIEQHKGADVCSDFRHCAAYVNLSKTVSFWNENELSDNKILQAVTETKGEVITYNNEPIIAVFSAASSEKSESALDVWGTDIPYLQSVESMGGNACEKYSESVTISASDFRKKVEDTFPSADVSGSPNDWFKASERSEAGGIKTVMLGGIKVEGTAIREMFGLNSTNFTITAKDDEIEFHTTGYGHGVGMSQYGAKYMAEQGKSYEEILIHYYTGTEMALIGD